MVHKQVLTKPDGRRLILYGRNPIQVGQAPSPSPDRPEGDSHFRWHPFRGEWVAYAAHRQHRTFLPPPEYNPLAPTVDPSLPTEMPAGAYDVGGFENRFSTMRPDAKAPPSSLVATRAGPGACEVVVYTPDATSSIGALSLDHL